MASDPDVVSESDSAGKTARNRSDLAAPRRVFKRKKRSGVLLALKIGLPLVAFAGIAYVVIWSRIINSDTVLHPIEDLADVSKSGSDTTVSNVKYDGIDAHNRPFTITADSATQPGDKVAAAANPPAAPDNGAAAVAPSPPPDILNLQKPYADMTMADGAWVAIKADSGVYDRDTGVVDLSGNVKLFHDTGLSFETDAATLDVRNESAKGNQPIEGGRSDGEIVAEGFNMQNNGRIITFTGRAFLKLYPKAKSGPQSSGKSDSGGNG